MEPIVVTESGPVRGLALGAVDAYLGVPYGASTAGTNRFRAPQEVKPWREVRDATAFGPAAPQLDLAAGRLMSAGMPALGRGLLSLLYPFSGSPVGGTPVDEDCLVLNVWTPGSNAGPALPVMVWLHGGAFVHGAGSEPAFWGDRLADRGQVVVVTLNHRLGALGYLPVSDDAAPDAGQAGMLDIVMALRWVRDNITAFGGDPGNVTLFGQSGGGMKISTLLAMPAATGLFHKAIIQSGAGLWLPQPDDAAPLGQSLCQALGMPGVDIEALRAEPAGRLVAAQFAAAGQVPALRYGFAPVVDGAHISAAPMTSPELTAPDVPLLIGCTTEEAGMFLAMDPAFEHLDDDALGSRLRRDTGDHAAAILQAYRAAFPGADAGRLLRRIETDRDIRVTNRQFVERKAASARAPIYSYLFDYDTGVLGGAIGAAHSVDLAFAFDNVDRVPLSGGRPGRDEVARQMAGAWAAFAHTGSPQTSALPPWPPHSARGHEAMVFTWPGTHVESDPGGERLRLMAGFDSRVFARAGGVLT